MVFISLYGSQNYGLDVYDDEYMSDVDTKAVVLPSFEDIVYNKTPISTTIELENKEHIDVKDVRVMFENYKKQNVNFVETLFTDYKVVNPKYEDIVSTLFDKNEQIAHINTNQMIRCMSGMSMEKKKALQHPYPTIIDKIEKYGYDPKQLHHIIRINDFIKEYIAGIPFKQCLQSQRKQFLINVKKGCYLVEEAVKVAEFTDEDTRKVKELYIKDEDVINKEGIEVLDKVKFELLKRKFKADLQKE